MAPQYKKNVISLSGIEELHELGTNKIGAMVTLQELVESSSVHPLISEVASKVASIMVRRSATLGEYLPRHKMLLV